MTPSPDDQATAAVLTVAKWWTAGFAALGAAVLTGVSLADLRSLRWNFLIPALLLAIAAFLICVWLLVRVRRVFVPLVSWETLTEPEKGAVSDLGYTEEEILRWRGSTEQRGKAAAARAEILSRVTRQRTEAAFRALTGPFAVGIVLAFLCFLGFVVVTGVEARTAPPCTTAEVRAVRLDGNGNPRQSETEACIEDPHGRPVYVVPTPGIKTNDFESLVTRILGADCAPADNRVNGWLVSRWSPESIVVTSARPGCPSILWQLDAETTLAVPR